MKLRRIMSAMLAAALVTSTVAFAEDAAINITVENDKGTYTFTDEESAAFVDYFNEENDFDEVNTFAIPPVYIYGEDSSFTVADGKEYSLNEIYRVEFEFIDIQKDADGNTTFKKLCKANTSHPLSGTSMWGPGSVNDDGRTFTDTTITVSELIPYMDNWGEANIIDAELTGEDVPEEPAFTHEDVDMIMIWFYINDEFDENGNAVYPSDGSYSFYGDWFISESAVEMLNEANAAAPAPDDTTSDETASGDGADTSADDETASGDDTSTDNAGSTEGADGEDKQSADTGAQGVAAAAGIALAAGAAVLFSRKRK